MISLPPHLRYEYCDLWASLFLGNLPRVAEICRLWGLGTGSEDLIGSAVLLRRPGTGGKKGTGIATEKRNAVGEKSVENRIDKAPEEAKAKELEAQRAMKAKLKGFLENYDLIPKVCTHPFVFPRPAPHSDTFRRIPGTHFHRPLDAHHSSK